MIGMATVASPELEGIKNESGMKSRNRMSTKRAPLSVGDRVLPPS